MITKREKLQYVYVFLTDLSALAASVILAWLIVGGIMGQLLPYSVLDLVQALVLRGGEKAFAGLQAKRHCGSFVAKYW